MRTSAPASPPACLHVRNPARSLNTPPPRALRPELIARSEYRGQSWASLPCLTAATYAWSAANTWSGSERGQRRGWGQGPGQGQGQGPKAWAKAWARVGVRVGSGSVSGVRGRGEGEGEGDDDLADLGQHLGAPDALAGVVLEQRTRVLQLRQPKVARRALDPVRVLVYCTVPGFSKISRKILVESRLRKILQNLSAKRGKSQDSAVPTPLILGIPNQGSRRKLSFMTHASRTPCIQ